LSTTAIFIVFGGYFFKNFKDQGPPFIWRYTKPCRLVIDYKMNIPE